MMQRKLLITGASGFLGWHLMRLAVKDWDVYGLGNNNQCNFPAATILKCDVTNYLQLGDYFEDIEPDAVIHTAAIADANFCQRNKELSYGVNVEATRNMAGICSDFNIPFAFTSTDLVFDGTKSMYRETDEKNPLSTYSEHKSLAEDEVLNIYPQSVVFRLPFMLGHPNAGIHNYFSKFVSQLSKGEDVKLFTDEFRSVAGACSISGGILQLFEKNTGLIHLAGIERFSRYETGLEIAKAMNLNASCIKPSLQADIEMDAPRPKDVSLDISKALALGYNPLLLHDELRLIAENNYLQ
jgi:dTDP-4-dehydrorhamnose reductase